MDTSNVPDRRNRQENWSGCTHRGLNSIWIRYVIWLVVSCLFWIPTLTAQQASATLAKERLDEASHHSASAEGAASRQLVQEYPVGIHKYGKIELSENQNNFQFNTGIIQIIFSKKTGLANFAWNSRVRVSGAYSSVQLGRLFKSSSAAGHSFSESGIERVEDGFGKGVKVSIVSATAGAPTLRQNYYLYEDKPYFFIEVIAESETAISSNWIAPLVMDAHGGLDIGSYSDDHVLFVPWDNDHFIRFRTDPINGQGTSYETTAIYDNSSRKGLIVGSVTHDTWKTGIEYSGSGNKLDHLTVYGGASSAITQDTMPHGKVSGASIVSPRIFVGYYDDWRAGMEDYGAANAVITPPLPWTDGMHVGWNSWAAYRCESNSERMIGASDFIKNDLQNKGYGNNGSVYVNWDAACGGGCGPPAYDTVAQHIRANGQYPGNYFAPFARFGRGRNDNAPVPGTDGKYTWNDILLRDANNNFITFDGGRALDPTHPGTRMYVRHTLNNFKRWGYEYVKLDFLSHAAVEGKHYLANMTAMQAYNYGMQYIRETIGGSMFISLSIAPLFPGTQYAHSRRISCDAFGSIHDTEYMLNSLTYGWWLGKYYRYNDGDHVVTGPNSLEEAQSRISASTITGMFLDSDKLADDPNAQARAKDLLTRSNILDLARKGRSFRPVEGNTGNKAADVFVLQDGSTYYVAVFNYTAKETNKSINLARVGLSSAAAYKVTDLWNGSVSKARQNISVHLRGSQATILRFN